MAFFAAAGFLGAGFVDAEALVLVTRPLLVLPRTFFSSTTAGASVVFLVTLAPVLDLGLAALVVVAFLVVALVVVLAFVALGLAAAFSFLGAAAFFGAAVLVAAFFAAGFFSPAGLAASFLASLMVPEVPVGGSCQQVMSLE